MNEIVMLVASIYGGLAVIFGAFAAHLLKRKLSSKQLASFETGVRYQMFHAIVLLVVGLEIPIRSSSSSLMVWFFMIGTFLFSFSIYGLCLSSARGKKIGALGPVTPIGGLFLVGGWAMLLVTILNLTYY